ncbi:protease modulator HflC [Marinilabiliaceae bacterium ANBcel2]|nr:protease modulator HflC [Marinilabiliaceae bacterium ANBcel2]
MSTKNIISVIVAALIAIVVYSSIYIVDETEQAVVTQFGRPVGDAVTTPGLNFKVPFIQKVNFFEKRFLEWDGDPNQIPTRDKKYIFVDSFARWQITDPLRFFIRLTNERNAMSRIADILDGETRDHIANHNLEEAVRSTNREPVEVGEIGEMIGDSLARIDVGRDQIQRDIRQSANEQTRDLGIVILDFKIKRINYVPDVREQVYDRMKSERHRIAEEFRSEGHGEASVIHGERERELQTIRSEAYREAEEIRGRADATAANIYAAAYNRSRSSRELYQFIKSMETLEKTFDKETKMILSTDSDLYQYLKGMQ